VRVGVVDIGTNTVRLLIADTTEDGFDQLIRLADVTRLGQAVDRTGELHPDAMRRTLSVLTRYGAAMDEHGVAERRIVATSATRHATNVEEFLIAVEAAVGTRPAVIDGAEEAALAFAGATSGLPHGGDVTMVIDVGGGSTEFVVGGSRPILTDSVEIGSVRLTERFLGNHPVDDGRLEIARGHVALLFSQRISEISIRADHVIGVAGTFTTLAAIHLGLDEYDPDRVHLSTLSSRVLSHSVSSLAALTVDQIRAIPSMAPGRAEVILGGAIIAELALAHVGHEELTVSEHDILDGIAMSLAKY